MPCKIDGCTSICLSNFGWQNSLLVAKDNDNDFHRERTSYLGHKCDLRKKKKVDYPIPLIKD